LFSDVSLVGDWPVLVGMWLVLVGRTSCAGGRLACAGERWACDRVVARTSCAGKDCAGELGEARRLRFLLAGIFGLVDWMPDLDAVMCPSAVAGL
jgi:hypothetical protein